MLFKPGDKVYAVGGLSAGDIIEGISISPEVISNDVKTIKEFVSPKFFAVEEDCGIYPEKILRHNDTAVEFERARTAALQNQLDAKKWSESQEAHKDMSGSMFYCYKCPYCQNHTCTKTDVRTLLCLCAEACVDAGLLGPL